MTFPNFKGKHAHDAVFSPNDFLKYTKHRWEKFHKINPKGLIIIYQEAMKDYILKNYKVKKLKIGLGTTYILPGNKIAVLHGFGIGSPVATTKFDEFIAAGITHAMNIGTAGTVSKKRNIGDFVVCDRAIRDEGTSHHYLPKGKYSYPDKKMTDALITAMGKTKYTLGTTWTIDTPYRETVEEVKHYQKEGVQTVEMEAAAMFAVAKFRKIPIGSLFVVSDSLAEYTWKPRMYHVNTHARLGKAFEIAKKALESVI